MGDDIAWMRIDTDGRLWAVNPEVGFFGVAPGTNARTNPNAMATVRANTIFTNVVLSKDGTVWWEEGDDAPPTDALDWLGRPWHAGMTVRDILRLKNYRFPMLVIHVNDALVNKKDYDTTAVPDGAVVKVIHLISGG